MNIRICIVTLLFTVFLGRLSVFAEDVFFEGYIIDANNDTVKGWVADLDARQVAKVCHFKPKENSSVFFYYPNQIKAYHVKNKWYVAKNVVVGNTRHRLFFEYLVDGILDLYGLDFEGEQYYLIVNENGEYKLMNTNRGAVTSREDMNEKDKRFFTNKGSLKYFMKDYSDIYPKIDNSKLGKKSLVALVKEYHDGVCSEYGYIDYTKGYEKPAIYLGLSSGAKKSMLVFSGTDRFDYIGDADVTSEMTFFYGLLLSIDDPSISKRFSFVFELLRTDENFTYNYEGKFNGTSWINYTTTSFNINVLYRVVSGKVDLVPSLGFGINNVRNYHYSHQLDPGYSRSNIEFYKNHVTFNPSLLIDKQLSEKLGLKLRASLGANFEISNMQKFALLGDIYYNYRLGLSILKRIN
jgi:hypothetical protein